MTGKVIATQYFDMFEGGKKTFPMKIKMNSKHEGHQTPQIKMSSILILSAKKVPEVQVHILEHSYTSSPCLYVW